MAYQAKFEKFTLRENIDLDRTIDAPLIINFGTVVFGRRGGFNPRKSKYLTRLSLVQK